MKSDDIITYSREKRQQNKPLIAALSVTVVLLLLCLIVFVFICSPMIIKGDSMTPTLNDGQLIMISKIKKEITYDDIVIYKRPNENFLVIKRVVGVYGDTFSYSLESLTLSRNGEVISAINEEQYFALLERYQNQTTFVLDYGEILTLGDNRIVSVDGRNYGAINVDDIIGVKI